MSKPDLPASLFSALFEKHPSVKLLINPDDGTIIDANIAAAAFYGYNQAALRGMHIWDLNALPRSEIVARMSAAARRKESRFIFPHKLASGEIRTVEVRSGPIEWDGRNYLLSVIHDITQAHRDRTDLERFFQVAPDPLVIVRENGTFARVNRTFAKLLGYTQAQIVDRHVLDFVHPTDHARLAAEMAQRRTAWDYATGIELQMVCRDGTIKTLVWDAAGDRQRRCVYAAAHDLTAQKRAEESLRAAETKFRAIANYTCDWESWIGCDGAVRWVNPMVEQYTGYKLERVLAMPNYPESLVCDDDRERVRALMADARAGGSGSDVRFRIRCRGGEAKWMEAAWRPIEDDAGHALGTRVSIRDISATVAHEEERERLLRELQDALDHVRTLRGLIPICAACKRIRNDQGYWEQIEVYIRDRSDAEFTHGICPTCAQKLYPECFVEEVDPGAIFRKPP